VGDLHYDLTQSNTRTPNVTRKKSQNNVLFSVVNAEMQRGQPNNWRGASAISAVRPLINLIIDTILLKKKY